MTARDIELNLCKKNFMFFVAYCSMNLYHTKFVFYDFHREVTEILLNLNTRVPHRQTAQGSLQTGALHEWEG